MINILGRYTDFGYCYMSIIDDELVALEFDDIPNKFCEIFTNKVLLRFKGNELNNKINTKYIKYADEIADAINNQKQCPIPLKIVGREFQVAVWNELLNIAPGTVKTYNEIANAIGKPGYGRAVGNYCSQNKIAYFIPSHRVVGVENMGRGIYKWGMERKRLLLAREGVKI